MIPATSWDVAALPLPRQLLHPLMSSCLIPPSTDSPRGQQWLLLEGDSVMGMEQGLVPASGAKPGPINEPHFITDGGDCISSPAGDFLHWDPHSPTSDKHGTVQRGGYQWPKQPAPAHSAVPEGLWAQSSLKTQTNRESLEISMGKPPTLWTSA